MKLIDIHTNNSKVCCIADLHIGVHQNSIFWHDIALKWANWLAEELNRKGIKDIFILGDIYHYRDEVAVNTIHVVHQILSLWKDFNIVVLVGNHDAYYKDRSDINSLSILNGKQGITVIDEPVEVQMYGKKVTFLPWGASTKDINQSDILFGHLEIESFKMNGYKLCDHGVKTSSLLNRAKLIMTGHFHLREERKYDNGTIIYVGNPFEMDFGDAGTTKGYYILDIDSSKYEFFCNDLSPKHKKIALGDLLNYKEEDYTSIIPNSIVKILIDQKIHSDEIDTIIKRVSSYSPFSLSVDYSLYNSSITVEDQNYSASGVDLQKTIEEFVNVLDIEEKQKVIDYCLSLYNRVNML